MTISSRRVTRHSHPMAIAVAAMLVAGLLPAVAAPALAVAGPYLIVVGAAPAAVPAGNQFTLTVGTSSDGTTVRGDLTANVTVAADTTISTVPATPVVITGTQAFAVTLPTPPPSGTEVNRTITISAPGYVSKTVNLKVTAATTLVFTTQPGSSAPGSRLGTSPVVAIQDDYGNNVANATQTVSLALLPSSTDSVTYPSGSLTACYGTLENGLTTFTGCRVSAVGREYRLRATAPGLTTATSAGFDVSARLAFSSQPPTSIAVGSATMNPKVTVNWTTTGAMSDGTRSRSDNTTIVTLAIKSGTGASGATLTCDTGTTLTVVAGLADFQGCRIDKASTGYKLVATSSPAMTTAESNAIDVTAGAASKLAFLQEPTTGTAGAAFTKQPIVAITDAGGNVSKTSSATISLSLAFASDSSAVLTCSSGKSLPTTNGQVSFSGCSISKPGTYTIVATATSALCGGASCALTGATSSAFTLTQRGATVSLTASASTVTVGQRLTLTTYIEPNGGDRAFKLQRSRDGVTWSNWLSLATDSTGYRAYAYTPSYNFYYRSVYAGAADLTAGTSSVARVYVRQTARITPHATAIQQVALGRSKTYATIVRPKANPAGRGVVRYYLYKRESTGWELVRTSDVAVNSSGIARFANRFTSRGTYRVRSVALATTHNTKSLYTTWEYVRVP